MSFRWFIILILFLELSSCESIITKKSVYIPKIEEIDYSSIDSYPIFSECDENTLKQSQKECFYKLLSKKIEQSLNDKKITYLTVNDTILVYIKVNSKGQIQVNNITINNDVRFKELKIAITQSIEQLPETQPAIKMGIPVTTEFLLPIVVNSPILDK